jgi:2-dehydro-3-deoxyphosphooctonate aldolase (KDO 8-P synthase)
VGFSGGIDTLAEINKFCPVLTDVHLPVQCKYLAQAVTVLQIPALLCRQTDLLVAAGDTGLQINIKKGQFMSPYQMRFAREKVPHSSVWLCERGTFFGYENLVVDMRSLVTMRSIAPVIFDATHSVQQPGGTVTSGQRRFVYPLARAAAAVGIDGIFLEVHNDPDNAPSDGDCMLRLKDLKGLLDDLFEIDDLIHQGPGTS